MHSSLRKSPSPFSLLDADFFGVGDVFFRLLVAVVFEVDCLFRLVFAEQVCVLVFVASCDELFQPKLPEIQREIQKEIADAGIIAVAQDDLVFEVFLVVPKLSFDVGQYCVELIVLGALCCL